MKTLISIFGTAAAVPSTHKGASAFQWRAFISVTVMLCFLMLLVSGTCLSIAPPGRIANWSDWTILGLRKAQWQNLHLCFGLLFVFASVLHLALNWRPLLGYFRSRLSRHFSFRREWAAAVILFAVIFAATRLEIPPISSLLAFTENIRQSWEGSSTRRLPVPSAELLTSGSEMRTQRFGQGGGGGGSGLGRWTLTHFCEQEGIEPEVASERLKAAGIQASANWTLREIAEHSGTHRPYDIQQIVRGH